jgi:hypothetical protein
VTVLPPPETTPAVTLRLETGTPSCVEAKPEQHLLAVGGRCAGLRRAARDAAAAAAAAGRVQPRLRVRVDHLIHGRVQLFGDQHQDAGRRAVAKLGLAVGDDHRVVGPDRDPRVDRVQVGQEVGRGAGGERRVAGRGRSLAGGGAEDAEADHERAAALDERLARKLLLMHETGHHAPAFAITAAAFWIAVRILG